MRKVPSISGYAILALDCVSGHYGSRDDNQATVSLKVVSRKRRRKSYDRFTNS